MTLQTLPPTAAQLQADAERHPFTEGDELVARTEAARRMANYLASDDPALSVFAAPLLAEVEAANASDAPVDDRMNAVQATLTKLGEKLIERDPLEALKLASDTGDEAFFVGGVDAITAWRINRTLTALFETHTVSWAQYPDVTYPDFGGGDEDEDDAAPAVAQRRDMPDMTALGREGW